MTAEALTAEHAELDETFRSSARGSAGLGAMRPADIVTLYFRELVEGFVRFGKSIASTFAAPGSPGRAA